MVIGILGILAGITISVIEPDAQNDRAQDSIRLANLEKIVTGIEAFRAAEGIMPTTSGNTDYNPLDNTPGLNTYLSVWPDNEPEGTQYMFRSGGGTFGVQVWQSNNRLYKYHTTYGEIRDCASFGGATNPNLTTCNP